MQDFLWGNFAAMNQKKYLVSAVLLLFLLAGTYFIIRKFNNTKVVENSPTIIDTEEPIDSLPKNQLNGKMLYQRCTSCHSIFKDGTGPALAGVSERWPDKKELFAFIRNPWLVISRNVYARKLKDEYKSIMPAYFLTDNEIQSILDYTKSQEKAQRTIP